MSKPLAGHPPCLDSSCSARLHPGRLPVQCVCRKDWPEHRDTWGHLTLSSHYVTLGKDHFPPGFSRPLCLGQDAICPPALRDSVRKGPEPEVTWKEVKESSVSSLTKRSVPRACSSITKAKMTSWVPSRGMSVSVDLASLGEGWGCHSGPLRELISPFCALSPHQGLASGSQTPFHPKYPGPGCLEGRRGGRVPRSPGAAPGMRARPGVPGKAQVGEGHVGLKLGAPGSPSLLEGRAEGA